MPTAKAPAQHRPGRILIVDDSETVRSAIRRDVEAMGMFEAVHEAPDGFAALRLLKEQAVDVILCDLEMPRCSGYDLLRLRAADARIAEIPLLMLTGADDIASRIRVLSAGASDYVCKPAHPEELRARLSVHLHLKLLLDELRNKGEALERLARTDTLTQLSNRRHLDEVLDLEFARCTRYERPIAVVMIDLDHFKRLNDTHGHAAGDKALSLVAATLRQEIRSVDLAARYGGEEFAVVMPETAPGDALNAAERIRKAVAAIELTWEGTPIPLTASFGVAGLPNPSAHAASDLFERADAALYKAKEAGRNCVQLANGT